MLNALKQKLVKKPWKETFLYRAFTHPDIKMFTWLLVLAALTLTLIVLNLVMILGWNNNMLDGIADFMSGFTNGYCIVFLLMNLRDHWKKSLVWERNQEDFKAYYYAHRESYDSIGYPEPKWINHKRSRIRISILNIVAMCVNLLALAHLFFY